MCQQHSAHLRVLVLAFINNRLQENTDRERHWWPIYTVGLYKENAVCSGISCNFISSFSKFRLNIRRLFIILWDKALPIRPSDVLHLPEVVRWKKNLDNVNLQEIRKLCCYLPPSGYGSSSVVGVVQRTRSSAITPLTYTYTHCLCTGRLSPPPPHTHTPCSHTSLSMKITTTSHELTCWLDEPEVKKNKVSIFTELQCFCSSAEALPACSRATFLVLLRKLKAKARVTRR